MNIWGLLILMVLLLVAALPWLIHRLYRAPVNQSRKTPADFGLPYRNERITTVHDKQLATWFIPPSNKRLKSPAVTLLHGWGGHAGHMLPFASLLHEAGYAVLLLEARNHGNSDRDSFSSMPRFAEDMEHALDWLKQQPEVDSEQLFLLGHSLGAAATLLLASRRNDLAGVVSVAAFSHPASMMRRQMQAQHIPYFPIGWLVLRYIQWVIGARLDDIAPSHTISQISAPVLLIHGQDDQTVAVEDALQIHAHRRDERVQLMLLENSGHDLRKALSSHAEALLAFFKKHTKSG
ncbi:MAG: alpha/beta fold hydrolase [gamma proteobacterium symbiont of Bathyaustriella thionipta]|nr:alpha/beta fold hydrolase [gamma proteobacterium symbiont of Bathyaustriella thionipta]